MTRRRKVTPALTTLLLATSSLSKTIVGFTIHTRHAVQFTNRSRSSLLKPVTYRNHLSSSAEIQQEYYDETKTNSKSPLSILICGDGDMSFGASFATRLADRNSEKQRDIRLVVSVLESESAHSSVFRNSVQNLHTIRDLGHDVIFGVDATDLSSHFTGSDGHRSFDRIQFNFPHWKGKNNTRRNRELLQKFFTSSKKHLSPHGEIHVALTEGQGGMHASTVVEWKQSWMPARDAAERGFLLSSVLPFKPTYYLSAYKWKDQAFDPGDSYMYVFSNFAEEREGCDQGSESSKKTSFTTRAIKDIQLYSYFNVLVTLPPFYNRTNVIADCMRDEIINLQSFARSHAPIGIRIEVNLDKIMEGITDQSRRGGEVNNVDSPTVIKDYEPYAVYRIALFGETQPLTQRDAEAIRIGIEEHLMKEGRGVTGRARWCASNVYPSSILGSIRPLGI